MLGFTSQHYTSARAQSIVAFATHPAPLVPNGGLAVECVDLPLQVLIWITSEIVVLVAPVRDGAVLGGGVTGNRVLKNGAYKMSPQQNKRV
jgi:hypothetical protein